MPAALAPSTELQTQFGDIDIYLFDQLMRGRFDARRRVLDAGCGAGRNLPYFLTHGFDVHAADPDAEAIAAARRLVAALAPSLPEDRIRQATLEMLPWPDAAMEAVVCSAVLHFARDRDHFDAMLGDAWRVLAPGGMFFARLASSIGIESLIEAPAGRVRLPDGSMRFVVNERMLLGAAERLGGRLLDPIKTTNVQNQRAMTTWVMEKT